jgi:hypothetical protein
MKNDYDMTRYSIFILFLIAAYSCTKHDNPFLTDPVESIVSGSGAFIINEGNFRAGNGSLSYYSYDSAKISNNIFMKITGRPLGDVPNSMQIYGDMAYIVVNNSGRIEVVEKNTLKSVSTISGLISPRNISVINSNKAYVTSMYSDSVVILNLKDNIISGYIKIRRSSESIVLAGNKAFVASWIGGSEVMVINTDNDRLIDSIKVGQEPESMELDKNNTLWVLCNGGWKRENYAELVGLNIQSFQTDKRFVFPSKLDSPSCLKIDGDGDTLYFLAKGVRRMGIDNPTLPDKTLIEEGNHLFYKMGINPVSGEIIVTDAVDYQQNGLVLRYQRSGQFVSSSQAGIIPGSVCFKVKPSPVIE